VRQHIDVALRLFDLAELPLVQLCLFGLIGQRGNPNIEMPNLHVHLLTRRLTFDAVQRVRRATEELPAIKDIVRATIHNWDYAVPYDVRSPLLNLALEKSTARYFMPLDSAEQLCPGGIAALLERLVTTDSAAAIGGVAAQPMAWWGNAFLLTGPAELTSVEETPGPIFLLDRHRAARHLQFLAGDALGERSGFIARLRKKQAVDETLLGEITCIRYSV
jgi:hypothetical protein